MKITENLNILTHCAAWFCYRHFITGDNISGVFNFLWKTFFPRFSLSTFYEWCIREKLLPELIFARYRLLSSNEEYGSSFCSKTPAAIAVPVGTVISSLKSYNRSSKMQNKAEYLAIESSKAWDLGSWTWTVLSFCCAVILKFSSFTACSSNLKV